MRKQSPWGLPVSGSHTLIEVSNEPLTTNTPSNCREGWERWSQNQNKELKDAKPPHVELCVCVYLQRVHSVGVSLQRVQAHLCLGVPHLHHVVVAARHHAAPVVLNAAHRRQVASQDVLTAASRHVPHAQRGVPRARHHPEKKRERERHYIAAVTANQVKVNQRCVFVSLLKLRWPSSMSSCVTLICVCVCESVTGCRWDACSARWTCVRKACARTRRFQRPTRAASGLWSRWSPW